MVRNELHPRIPLGENSVENKLVVNPHRSAYLFKMMTSPIWEKVDDDLIYVQEGRREPYQSRET